MRASPPQSPRGVFQQIILDFPADTCVFMGPSVNVEVCAPSWEENSPIVTGGGNQWLPSSELSPEFKGVSLLPTVRNLDHWTEASFAFLLKHPGEPFLFGLRVSCEFP